MARLPHGTLGKGVESARRRPGCIVRYAPFPMLSIVCILATSSVGEKDLTM